MSVGTRKMPLPITVPMMIATVDQGPKARRSAGSGVSEECCMF
jgi:hypothetical protein